MSAVAKTKILLVAEDALRAANICTLLEEQGHDVFHAGSPGEAAEALEIQRFEFVLQDMAPGRTLSRQGLDRFNNLLQSPDRPLVVVLRESVSATEPLHRATEEPGVDVVVEGRFSATRLVEMVNELVHRRTPRSGPATPVAADGALPVFERDQFERQMNHDPRLIAEIVQLFVTETTNQMAALQVALDAGLEAQVKRLAHTLKGSFGAVYAHRAGAVAREMEAAAAQDLSSARRVMPRLELATSEIQSKLQQLLAD